MRSRGPALLRLSRSEICREIVDVLCGEVIALVVGDALDGADGDAGSFSDFFEEAMPESL